MNWFSLCGALPFLILAGASAADPTPIYDNGPPNHSNGYEMTHWIQGDDFTLTNGGRVQGIKFWSLEGTGSFQGSFVWQIFTNNVDGSPGVPLFGGTATNPTHTASGTIFFGYAEYISTFDIDSVNLPAGTYWLALHNGPLSNNSDSGRLFWETTNSVGPTPSRSLIAPFTGQWFSHFIQPGSITDMAFQVNGVAGPQIKSFALVDSVPRISFAATPGQTYRVEYKNSPLDAAWQPVVGADQLLASGNVVDVDDLDPQLHRQTRRIYRVRLCPCATIEPPSLTGFEFTDVPRVSFSTIAGQLYRVEYRNELLSGAWTPLPGAEFIVGNGQTIQILDTDPNLSSVPRRFYRATLL